MKEDFAVIVCIFTAFILFASFFALSVYFLAYLPGFKECKDSAKNMRTDYIYVFNGKGCVVKIKDRWVVLDEFLKESK